MKSRIKDYRSYYVKCFIRYVIEHQNDTLTIIHCEFLG